MENGKVYEGMLFDEVAEIIGGLKEGERITGGGYAFRIPQYIIRNECTEIWRDNIRRRVVGSLDVVTVDGETYCGTISARTLCGMLSGHRFTVTGNHDRIADAGALFTYLDMEKPRAFRARLRYVDYTTLLFWNRSAVLLVTDVGGTGESVTKSLQFPFTADEFDDAVTSLQCAADARYWEIENAEEA